MALLPRKVSDSHLLKAARGALIGAAVWLSLQHAPGAHFAPRLALVEETGPVSVSEVSSIGVSAVAMLSAATPALPE